MRALLLLGLAGLIACGPAAKKPANDATTASAEEGAPKWDSSSEGASSGGSTGSSSSAASSPSGSGASGSTASASGPTPGFTSPAPAKAQRSDEYDKEHTEIVLKRAARQVKENCGAAKDENGKAPGPWGKTSVAVVLGHNGHSKGSTVGPPYDGTPPGRCIVQAFSNLTFPPWSGPDTTVNWDIEVVPPAK